MDSETVTRALDLSYHRNQYLTTVKSLVALLPFIGDRAESEHTLISLTCVPPLPMIMLASCVTIKHRIEICWAGGSAAVTGADGMDGTDEGRIEVEGPASPLLGDEWHGETGKCMRPLIRNFRTIGR